MSRLVAAVFAVVTALAQKESGITTINTPIPTTSTASATGSASTHPSTITSGLIAATTSDPLLGLAESLLSEYKSTSLRPIPSEIVLDSSTFTVSSGFILTPPPTTSPTPASTTELRATLSHSSLASTPTNVASSPKGDMEAAIVIGVAVGGLALAVILFVALGAHRRKRKTGTYLKRRPITRSTNKDAEMWQALKHDGTAMTSPATPGPFKDEWSDGCSSTRNQGYLSGPSVRKQLPSPSTPLSSARLPLRRPDPTFSPTGSEEANVTDPLDAERTGLSPHHELDGRPLPPLPIESTQSPQELQGDAVFPSELSPYGRNSSKIEEETAAHLDRQLQLHRPLSWTPLMRPQRSSTPSTPKRQHSGALDAVSPLALMGFGGGNRKDLPLRPFSHQPQSTKSLPEPELTSVQNGSPSPELSRQASGHAPELNTTRLQRSVAFEQVQQRALARHPSQLTLSSFPSGQTIRLVNPSESPREPMSKPPSGPLLSQARYEPPPPKKARRASQVWGLNRARSGQHSVEDDGEPRDSRRASGPMLLPTRYEPPTPSASNNSRRASGPMLPPTRYEPPTPSASNNSRRPCELESPEFTSTHESAKASDTNRNKAELSSPVGNLSHPTDKNNQATALRATVPIVESTKSVDPENHTQSQIEPQRASPNQFAAPSNPDFFEQQKMQTNRTRNVDRKPVSSTASFESMEIRAYQASLPPWTQPYAPTLHAIPGGLNAPSMDATPQPRGLGPSRAYSARNVHYPSWSEISEFDFTGDGSNPVRFLRPQRSFGQLVSSKVREIEERVELLGSLPAGYVSGSLHSGSRPGTPRSANNSHGHAI